MFLCFQVRSLAHSRFAARRAEMLSPAQLAEVEEAVRHCLGCDWFELQLFPRDDRPAVSQLTT